MISPDPRHQGLHNTKLWSVRADQIAVSPVGRTTAQGAGGGAVRDTRNNGKEGGQTNESLNTGAAHAADATGDAAAADWKEAGGHRGGAGRERDPERGAAPRPLWARDRAAPQPTLPLRATRAPLAPGVNSPDRPKQSLQTSAPRRGVPGEAGAEQRQPPSRSPDLRPAPRRRTCDSLADRLISELSAAVRKSVWPDEPS
ncbi:hypothetical protein NN561_003683 [Cricetulus griseus]